MTALLEDLRTDRLLLRPLRADDLPAVLEIQTDPRTHLHDSYLAGPEEVRQLFEAWLRHWADHGFGYLTVVEQATGAVIGIGGVQERELDGERVLNLFYRFRPSAWGKGYAAEMAGTVVDWAERTLPGLPVVVITNVGNAPARRVAEKLGFAVDKEADYQGAPAVYYRRRVGRR
ncbi:GNAT family N-acetyltransferase [Prauserella muralis]|uniref:GNAT family N-acetyltransferase n=1 Tax=Prauserella muralis TaxID=588067 RepID=UPI0011ACB365|nr:GNAT family N-acetyltransferase [Prauserella muralis]TWE29996.1 RimJ/RimL family protein N-acetyltransferase [Prauserella muralis]